MADSLHNEDLLLRYLDGELTDAEKHELEERLRTEPALKEELERLQIATHAIRQYGVRQKVGSLHKEMMQELKVKPKVIYLSKSVRVAMAVAASILVLFVGVKLYLES